MMVAIGLSQCCLAARLVMLRTMIGLSARKYLREVYLNVILVTTVAAVLPILTSVILEESFLNFVIIVLISLITAAISIFYIGFNKNERDFAVTKFKYAIQKLAKKK